VEIDLDWGRLRDYVRREIDAPGGYGTQAALAAAMPNFGARSMSEFLTGKTTLRANNRAKLEVALSWEPGSAMVVLRGGEPRRLTRASIELSPAAPSTDGGDIVRGAELEELVRMQAAVTEVFDAATGEEFLRRALQLRAP
jgi:hypothetical protein